MFIEQIGEAAAYENIAEEAVELAHAALKYARIIREENPTPKTKQEVFSNILEEYSDLILISSDVGLYINNDIIEEKRQRFIKRMSEKNNEHI